MIRSLLIDLSSNDLSDFFRNFLDRVGCITEREFVGDRRTERDHLPLGDFVPNRQKHLLTAHGLRYQAVELIGRPSAQ